MSEYTKQLAIVMAKNVVVILGFIFLAMFFAKWWISLFSILFVSTIDWKKVG